MNEFEEKWIALADAKYESTRLRAYPDHMFDFHVQYSSAGNRELVLELRSEEIPEFELPGFRNIETVKALIPGGMRIVMVLLEPDLARNFSVMCYDLAERSKAERTVIGAVTILLRVLESWAELFRRRLEDGISKEEVVGLFGELLLLEELIQEDVTSLETLIDGWRGPDGDARDIGIGGVRIEVKTQRSTAAMKLRISSLEQLNDRGDSVFIVLWRISASDKGRSVLEVAQTVLDLLRTSPLATLEFERKIALTGMEDGSSYCHDRYDDDEKVIYSVSHGFPRLVPGNVPDGVVAAQYEVAGPSLEAFRSTWNVLIEATHA